MRRSEDMVRNIPIPIDPVIDFPQLRSELARRCISVSRFAEKCGMNRNYVSEFIRERRTPSQMSRIKIAVAASRLGLSRVYRDRDDPLPTDTLVVSTLVLTAR
jgi:transcriptional regulator with XRE-family HTH domain